ncbi:MAG: vitamin B12 transporter [Halieaceae bacterium]|jgi:vitamin B12 transporter
MHGLPNAGVLGLYAYHPCFLPLIPSLDRHRPPTPIIEVRSNMPQLHTAKTCSAQVALWGLALIASPGTTVAANPLEELVITSSRVPMPLREVGTSVSVLLKEEILQRGFLSLPDLLRTQTSVAVSNNGGLGKASAVRIRGEEGYRTQVLIDGIDIADTSSPQVGPRMEQLVSAGIERIEILRGPQGLAYGADAGGIIDIRTASPDEGLAGGLALEAGRYGTQQLSGRVGGAFETLDFMVSASQLETDGFNTRTTDDTLRDADGYENSTFHVRAGWEPSDQLRLEAVVRQVDGDNAFDSCFSNAFLPTDDCEDTFQQDSWRLAAQFQSGALSHELALTDSKTEREFFAQGEGTFAADGGLQRISYVGSWHVSDAMALVYGADHETESIDDGSVDRERKQRGVYAEIQGRFAEALTLSAGLRNDDNDDFGSYSSYRLSAAWVRALGVGQLKLKASAGTGFRAPSLYEVSYNSGPFASPPASDSSLDAESSEGYDFGIAWASDRGTYLEMTWFDQRIDDLITFDLASFSGYLQTAGESKSRGLELAAAIPLSEAFELTGNFTYNDTEAPDGTQRAFRPEQLLNLGLSYRLMGERLRIGGNLRHSAEAVDTLGAPVDDYLLLDFNAR